MFFSGLKRSKTHIKKKKKKGEAPFLNSQIKPPTCVVAGPTEMEEKTGKVPNSEFSRRTTL